MHVSLDGLKNTSNTKMPEEEMTQALVELGFVEDEMWNNAISEITVNVAKRDSIHEVKDNKVVVTDNDPLMYAA